MKPNLISNHAPFRSEETGMRKDKNEAWRNFRGIPMTFNKENGKFEGNLRKYDCEDAPPLYIAIMYDNLKMVQLLVEGSNKRALQEVQYLNNPFLFDLVRRLYPRGFYDDDEFVNGKDRPVLSGYRYPTNPSAVLEIFKYLIFAGTDIHACPVRIYIYI